MCHAPIRGLELSRRFRLTDHEADLHLRRVNDAAVGARDKPVGFIFKFRSRRRVRAHLAIKTDAHHRNDAAMLVLHFLAICFSENAPTTFLRRADRTVCAARRAGSESHLDYAHSDPSFRAGPGRRRKVPRASGPPSSKPCPEIPVPRRTRAKRDDAPSPRSSAPTSSSPVLGDCGTNPRHRTKRGDSSRDRPRIAMPGRIATSSSSRSRSARMQRYRSALTQGSSSTLRSRSWFLLVIGVTPPYWKFFRFVRRSDEGRGALRQTRIFQCRVFSMTP